MPWQHCLYTIFVSTPSVSMRGLGVTRMSSHEEESSMRQLYDQLEYAVPLLCACEPIKMRQWHLWGQAHQEVDEARVAIFRRQKCFDHAKA